MESFNEVWALIQEYCKQQMTEVAYNVWIDPISPRKFENDVATLYISSTFKKDIIADKYASLLQEAFENTLGFPVELNFITSLEENAAPLVPAKDENSPSLDYEYTFDTFIVGSSNKFAHAAAQAVAANPGGQNNSRMISYNPLFIHGNSGLGKTHLLNAICYEVQNHRPEYKIIYTRGEDFTNELINHIQTKSTEVFHDKYRTVDMLLVDDIQFIAGKASTQEEFFHTFNALIQDGKQIVLTSDRPPKEISTLEDRLRTRFEWGLLADIQPPDFETRMAILKRKAELLNFEIPDDVIQYIAEKVKTNIRQLEGTVKKLNAYHMIEGQSPTIILAQNSIRDILNDNQPVPVTIEKIITEVGRTYGVSIEDIHSNKRTANISGARQVSMYIIREITGSSMESIGAEFNKHHSTVIYAISQVTEEMKKDTKLRATIQDIIKNIREK